MVLNGRTRIQVDCTEECAPYEGKTLGQMKPAIDKISEFYMHIWNTLKFMVWSLGILTFFALLVILYVVKKGARFATQDDYFRLFIFVMLLTICGMGFSWYITYQSHYNYNPARKIFEKWSNCIISANNPWREVPKGIWETSNMDRFHRWVFIWACTSSGMAGLTLIIGLWSLSNIGDLDSRRDGINNASPGSPRNLGRSFVGSGSRVIPSLENRPLIVPGIGQPRRVVGAGGPGLVLSQRSSAFNNSM